MHTGWRTGQVQVALPLAFGERLREDDIYPIVVKNSYEGVRLRPQ